MGETRRPQTFLLKTRYGFGGEGPRRGVETRILRFSAGGHSCFKFVMFRTILIYMVVYIIFPTP